MATFLDEVNKAERGLLKDRIRDKKEEIAELTLRVASLEAELRDDVDYARRPLDNNGNAINDINDREKLLKFFHENTTLAYRTEALCIFWSYKNVLSMCREYKVDCPQWFVDKYCAILL